MSRTSLKQQLMREQLEQLEKKEALRKQQLQQIQQSNIKVDPCSIGTPVSSIAMDTSDVITNTAMMKLSHNSIEHSHPIIGSPDFRPNHHNQHNSFNIHAQIINANDHRATENGINCGGGHPSITAAPEQINYPQMNHHAIISNVNAGSGPQSPFPLSPESPLSGPRSSASEIDEYWEDVHRTLAVDMPDFLDTQNAGSPGALGRVGNSGGHHSHHNSHSSSHHHQSMDSAIASTLPAEMFVPFPNSVYSDSHNSQMSDKMSTSCPPLSEGDYNAWERERKKKDAHNRIERRRRYHINDRIKELSTLLPTQDEARYYELVKDMKQNKGTILKASVDFLRSLKRDVNRIPELERQKRELELENQKMSRRIQQLEQDLRSILTEDRNPY
ncbi:transcription factor Mitf [Brevipalpus obovatus]|uniref:transcription factor Mitf n=1 Tax=Brevipalpus obovatus TaxID=246614 RepID=UPI003D9DCF97